MGGLFHALRHPRRCYMVCATARSGSNLLTDGLHATRRAGRPKQFFLPKFEAEYGARHGLDAGRDFAGYVRGIIQAAATSNSVFGFKVMGWYLQDFVARVRDALGAAGAGDAAVLARAFPRLRYLRIIRENKLRQAISKARAVQSGLWKIQPGNAARHEPEFDRALIARCIEETAADEAVWDTFFALNGLSPHVVRYEELCAHYDATIRSTLAFLGIKVADSTPIEPVTVRQADALSVRWEAMYAGGAGEETDQHV